jgi:hypothetical protein
MLKPLRAPADGDHMRRPALLTALLLLALVLPGAGGAALAVGVTDDSGRDSTDGGASFLGRLGDVGLTENRISVVWNPDAPATIPSQAHVDAYVANATAAGVRLVFSVYPAKAGALTATPDAPGGFAGFLAQLAGAYPQVTDFVVGNEPNQPRFWQPQFSTGGTPLACSSYEPVLAAGYDALKGVNPAITVIGVGLSPRGNDIASAANNPSTSPVRCLRDIGAAYRASGRTKPIMDELAFHAYPELDSQPFGVASSWPKVGIVDLGRLKQAVWDAFNGTAQPTFAEAGQSLMLPALRLRVAEVGWQVGIVPSAQPAYSGTENVATTDETNQAADYTQAIRLLDCDASVKSLDFFGLEDETDLGAWQAGLIRADGSTRPSYDAVKSELATSHATCAGAPVTWKHTTAVVGVAPRFDARKTLSAGFVAWSFQLGVRENALFTAGLFRLSATSLSARSRTLIGSALAVKTPKTMKPALRLTGRALAPFGRTVTFPRKRMQAGIYVYAIRLAAEMNPKRVTFVTAKPFRVGAAAKPAPPRHKKTKKR